MRKRRDCGAYKYDDAMWLINLVENLLSVSRLEEGRMNLHVSTELMDEVVAEALRHINRKSAEYHLKVHNSEEYLLAQIDAKLIVQVIINIVDNAIKYTPPGSEIDITRQIWGKSWENDIASLRVFMATLRKKLEKEPDSPQYIQTHIGVGYRMMRVEP